MDSPWDHADPFDFTGDAHILFTGPFYPEADPLAARPVSAVPADGVLDREGRLVPEQRSLDEFHIGPLAFTKSPVEVVTHFTGSPRFTAAATGLMEETVGLPVSVSIAGMLFPDGYGSFALQVCVPGGWTEDQSELLLRGFGPGGREQIAQGLQDLLLPAVSAVCDNCCPSVKCQTTIPYLNATYAGSTDHPLPGRATLPDKYRMLIFPRTPAPIRSESPWVSEFYCPGSGFSVLAAADPVHTLGKLGILLLHLDVLYARMDNSAAAADRVLRTTEHRKNTDGLIAAEYRLWADYHALMQPSFSYDAHVTQLRDALLAAWDTDKNSARAEALLEMARQAVERQLAREQGRRVGRVNLVLTILTIISLVSSIDAAVDLWRTLIR